MYFEKGAMRVNPILSSHSLIKILIQKYKIAAEILCSPDDSQSTELSPEEIIMLIKTPSHRLLLEKSYNKVKGKLIKEDEFFLKLLNKGINRQNLISKVDTNSLDVISPVPYLTSLINPMSNSKLDLQDSSSITCEIYRTFPIFSNTYSKWNIIQPNSLDIENIGNAMKILSNITPEPIEDMALNIRYIAIVELKQMNSNIIPSVSFSFQFLPGIIFLGGAVLNDPIKLIESLYHETLHNKFVNTYHAYNMFNFNILMTVNSFACTWAKNGINTKWPFMRAFAAYHVYCHLLAFHCFIIEQSAYDTKWSEERIFIIKEKIQIIKTYIDDLKISGIMTDLGIEYCELLYKISEMR